MIKRDLFVKKLNIIIGYCLVFWCFFAFFFKANALNNFSSILLALGLILYICFDFKTAKTNFLSNLKSNFILLGALFILLSGAIIISLNPYFDSQKEFSKLLRRDFLFLVLLMLLSWLDKSNENQQKIIKFCFYAIIISFGVNLIYFFIQDIVAIESLNDRRHDSPSIIDRFFAPTFDVYFAFALIGCFFEKNKKLKIFFAFLLCVGIVFLILCGARGGLLAFGASLIFIIFVLIFKGVFSKKQLLSIISFIFIGILAFVITISQNDYLQVKYIQGMHSSGRDIIIKERFPLLLDSKFALSGLGAGDTQYQKFLNDQPAQIQEKLGPQVPNDKNPQIYKTHFWHDEPAILGIYWHYGILGSICFLFVICYLFFNSIKAFFLKNNYYLFCLGSSVFAYYFIAALFENFSDLKILINFCIIYLAFKIHAPNQQI